MRKLLADKALRRSVPIFIFFVLFACVFLGVAGAAGGEEESVFPKPLGYVSDYADLIEPTGKTEFGWSARNWRIVRGLK